MEKRLFDARQQVLDNGIKLITVKRDTQLTAIHVGINIGSLYEEKNEKGISHFIEHMLFKGTEKRSNEELNNELEQLGGEYNAYTEYTSTVYSVTALNEEIEKSLELLSDMVQNSNFPEEEIEKERSVILAEIRTSKDDVEDYSFAKINDMAFSKSPLKYDVIGLLSTVKSFKKQELESFYKKYYIPNNCYISIASSCEHEEMMEMVENYFGKWQPQYDVKKKEIIKEKNHKIKKISYKKDIEQSTIVYLYNFHDLDRNEELALKILNHKFGESSNSILFRQLREEKGLAYDVYTTLDLTNGVKTLYLYTAVSEEHVDEAIETIDDCIEKIKSEEIKFEDSTIELMKKVLKTAVASTLEDSTDLGNYVLHQYIDNESIYEFQEDMKNLENLKREDIYKVARKVFDKPTIHILLPEGAE